MIPRFVLARKIGNFIQIVNHFMGRPVHSRVCCPKLILLIVTIWKMGPDAYRATPSWHIHIMSELQRGKTYSKVLSKSSQTNVGFWNGTRKRTSDTNLSSSANPVCSRFFFKREKRNQVSFDEKLCSIFWKDKVEDGCIPILIASLFLSNIRTNSREDAVNARLTFIRWQPSSADKTILLVS